MPKQVSKPDLLEHIRKKAAEFKGEVYQPAEKPKSEPLPEKYRGIKGLMQYVREQQKVQSSVLQK